MGYSEPDEGPPGVSICPRCGARLVTRNLWHSCGTFTLEGLFPRSEPAVLDLARKYVAMLYGLGDVQVIPQKTRLTCVANRRGPVQPRITCLDCAPAAGAAESKQLMRSRVRRPAGLPTRSRGSH